MNAARLAILGATGDLTGRYLLRALAELSSAGALPKDVDILGVAREPWDDDQFRVHASRCLDRHAGHLPRSAREDLVHRLHYMTGDVAEPRVLQRAAAGAPGPVVAYLALPPAMFCPAISGLAAAGLQQGSRV